MPETKILTRVVIIDEKPTDPERLRCKEDSVSKEKSKRNSRAESFHSRKCNAIPPFMSLRTYKKV